jgi:hypothetical protein
MKKIIAPLLLFIVSGNVVAEAALTQSAPGAKVYIISPQDGSNVSSPVTIKFGLTGMGVAPAGVKKPNTGHHHLLIDTQSLPDLKTPLASSDRLKHFGKGQTEASLNLSPGKHTLQLVLGNYAHTPHDKPLVSEKITIDVK